MPGVAVVYAVGNLRVAFEQGPHTFHLVIRQRVHGINHNSADAVRQVSALLLPEKMVQNGQEKGFRLTRPGSGGDNEIFSRNGFQKRRLLM